MLNEILYVKEYEFVKPPIQKIDSIIDDCNSDCHHKFFHNFDHICVYDIIFEKFFDNETVKFKISDKSMGLFELYKKLAVARGNGF